jgi:hypothetical protein
MADRFQKYRAALESIAMDAAAITPGSSSLAQTTRALYVGNTGNVCVQMLGYDNSNTVVTFVNVPAGTVLPVRVTKVFSNSTANNFIGMF